MHGEDLAGPYMTLLFPSPLRGCQDQSKCWLLSLITHPRLAPCPARQHLPMQQKQASCLGTAESILQHLGPALPTGYSQGLQLAAS